MSPLTDLQSLIIERGVDGALAATGEWPAALRDPAVVRLVVRSRAVLLRDPGQLFSQLAGRLSDGYADLSRELATVTGPGLRLMSATLEPPDSPTVGSVAVHRRLVHSVVVLPDGDTCVTASEDGGRLGLVSLSTVEVIGWLHGHQGPVNHLAVDRDTGFVVSAGDDRTVRVWQVESGRQVHVLHGHEHYVRQVAVAGGRIVSASQDGTVRVWDLATGACRHVLRDHAADVMAVAISADGRTAASSSMDNTVLVWNLDQGVLAFPLYDTQSEVMRFEALGGMYLSVPGPGADPALHRECPTWLWLSPDGRQLASAQREVIWWDLPTGQELGRIANQGSFLQSAAVSPDGHQIAVAGLSGVQLWSRHGAETRLEASLTGDHTWSVDYNPDGSTLVSGSDDGQVHVWRPRVDPAWASRPVHPATISHVTTSADGRRAASIDSGGTIHLWDLDSGRLLGQFRHESARRRASNTGASNAGASNGEVCAFSADGGTLVSAGPDQLIRWDAHTGAELRRLPAPEGGGLPSALALLPGDRAALVGFLGPDIVRCGLSGGGHERLAGDIARTEQIRVGPDGAWAVTLGFVADAEGRERPALQCWNLTTDSLQWTAAAGRFIALAPDGTRMVTGSPHGENRIARWDLATGGRLAELTVPGFVVDTEWRGDELLLATTDAVHWVAADLSAVRRTLPLTDIHTLALVPGGRSIVVRRGSSPCDVVLLDLADGHERARFMGDAPVYGLVAAPDGDTVVVIDAQRRVHVLHVSP